MRKDSYYFSHDSDASDDPKIMLLISQWGLEGYGIFWTIIEHLRKQPEYKSHLTILKALASRFGSTEEKYKYVVFNFSLFEFEDEVFFYSKSLINRMKPLENKREHMRQLALKRWNKNNAHAMRTHNDTQCVSNASKVKKSKIKKSNIDISLNFYQVEKDGYQNAGYISHYSQFVDILLGISKHYDKRMDNVLQIENQVSYEEFCKLYDKAKSKQEKSLLSKFLLSMANDDKYTKGKKSLYLTLNNWLNKHE